MEASTENGVEIFEKESLFLSKRTQITKALKKPDGEKPFMAITRDTPKSINLWLLFGHFLNDFFSVLYSPGRNLVDNRF